MTKRFFSKQALILGLLTLGMVNAPILRFPILNVPLTVHAQPQSDCLPLPPAINPLALVKIPQVQKELKLTEWQVGELSKLEQSLEREVTQKYQRTQPTSQQWTEASKRRLFSDVQKLIVAKNQQLPQILRPPQFTRLREIMIQVYGWQSLNQQESVELLKLTRNQQNRLKKISEQMNRQVTQTFQMPRDNSLQSCQKVMIENRKKLDQIRQNSRREINQVLSAQQKELLQTLQGEPFALDTSSLF